MRAYRQHDPPQGIGITNMVQSLSFESAEKRYVFYRILIGFISNISIACIGAYFISSTNGMVFSFIWIMLALWIIELFMLIKNIVFTWIYFRLKERKEQTEALLAFLKHNNFPKPEDRFTTPEDYFINIAGDEKLDTELRMKSLSLAIRRRTYGESGKLSLSIQNAMSAEDALSRYAATFPV